MSRVRSLLRHRGADPLVSRATVVAAPETPLVTSTATPPDRTGEVVVLVDLPADPNTAPLMGWGAVHVGGGDLVSLSHAFASSGRLREATFAQWAADLQLARPHLGERAGELCSALRSLSPVDPQSALAAARATLASLVDDGVPVLALLGPTGHLAGRAGVSAEPRPMDEVPPELPGPVRAALDATLEASALSAGDTHHVSVALRRSLLRQRAANQRDAEPSRLVRGILEPHERATFDDELRRRTT